MIPADKDIYVYVDTRDRDLRCFQAALPFLRAGSGNFLTSFVDVHTARNISAGR